MANNVLEFYVKMKDLMSGGLAKVGQTAQSVFAKVQKDIESNRKAADQLSYSYNEVTTAIKQMESNIRSSTSVSHIRQMNRELEILKGRKKEFAKFGVGDEVGKGGGLLSGLMGGSIGKAVLRFAAPVAVAGTAFAGLKKAISAGMDEEMSKASLSTFLGKSGAESAFANIKKDAAGSIFGRDSLFGANRSLISAGLGADQARTDVMNLANAVAAVGGGDDTLGRMAANMQQIKTVGKATAMDIRQFGMAGINIYKMLADATGKSVDQVKDMDVSYELLSQAMAKASAEGGMYHGAMENMANTASGMWNKFKSSVGEAFANLGAKLLPLVKTGLEFISGILSSIMDWFNNLNTGAGDWSEYIDIVKNYYAGIWDMVKRVAGFVWSIVGGVIQWLGKSELIKDIMWAVGSIAQTVFKVVGWIADKLKWVWENIVQPMLNAVNTVYEKLKYPFGKPKQASTNQTPGSMNDAPGGLDSIAKMMKGSNAGGGGQSNVAQGITSGGPRVININGVKFTDKIEIHATTINESFEELEDKFRTFFARLLTSGAAVQ